MIAKIICPSCQTMGQFSVDGGNFKGPYRCWKCRALYTLDMVNSAVVSLQPLTDEEFKEIKAKQEAEKHGHTSGGGIAHHYPSSPTGACRARYMAEGGKQEYRQRSTSYRFSNTAGT
jgi:hypothetical protein